MKKFYFRILPLLLLAGGLSVSCSKKILPEQSRQYINDGSNGLTVENTFGNLRISCTYIPNQYGAWYEAQRAGEPYKQVLQEMQARQYFELKISDSSGTKEFLRVDNDRGHYQQRLNYLLNDFQRDVFLLDGSDTLSCLEHHLERTFSLLPYNQILLAFDNPHPGKIQDKTLLIIDREAGGPPMRLTIHADRIKKIPAIRIKKTERE